MRLRLEMDALPRLFDMLLFVFIVRHFFYASIDYRSFACSLTRQRAEAKKGCSPFDGKIRVQNVQKGYLQGRYSAIPFFAPIETLDKKTFAQSK